MKIFDKDNIREATILFKNGKYTYKHGKDKGRPPFERCVEVPWVVDKISQICPNEGDKLFDFGCNKAEYIKEVKKKYSMSTHGIDGKPDGKKYVDHFFSGIFNAKLKKSIVKAGPYKICTGISAIEHAGNQKHPDSEYITSYQREICDMMVEISDFCFISVPFGKRPGWATDKSRTNLYQFDCDMLDHIKSHASSFDRIYMEEIYKLDGEHWNAVPRKDAAKCHYRSSKSGASAVALISTWKEDK